MYRGKLTDALKTRRRGEPRAGNDRRYRGSVSGDDAQRPSLLRLQRVTSEGPPSNTPPAAYFRPIFSLGRTIAPIGILKVNPIPPGNFYVLLYSLKVTNMKKTSALIMMLAAAAGLSANDTLDDELLSAARTGDSALVENLLDRGAALEARDNSGEIALMKASFEGQVAVVETLLDRGADIEAREYAIQDGIGWNALMLASLNGQAAVVEILLDRGAALESREDTTRWTALMLASARGQVAVVETLLDRGADINARNEEGDTALDIAYDEGHREVINALRTAGAVR